MEGGGEVAVTTKASDDGTPQAVAMLAAAFSSLWFVTALTTTAFVVLYRLDLLGDLPIGALLGLLATAALAGELGGRRCGPNPSASQLTALIGVQILATSAVIYAIGWGPTLAIGYLFVVARDLEDFGSGAWRPALGWTIAGIVGGQAAIAVGLVHSYVAEPYVHGLAGLSCLGVAFVMHLLGSKTAQRERDQTQLRAGEASFRQLFADNPQPMWVYDSETLAFLEVNEAAVSHYGYSREQFLALLITDIRPAEDLARLFEELSTPTLGVRQSAWRHRLNDGRTIDVEVSSHALTFEGRPAVLVAIQDMTQRNELEAELRHQAFHDSLTNLANRALFVDRTDHAVRRRARDGGPVAVLVLDLDGFKTVNDSLGHIIGDALLMAVAARLQTALRSGDTAARLGGDEFAILLESLDHPEEASEVAQRVIDALAKPFRLAGKEVFMHASLGIAVTEWDEGAGDLLRNADAAMYRAKAQGKGCYRLFEPAMHTASLARLELEGDLRRAIDRGEFVLQYQPVVSLGTGRVVSLEALIRWQHPTKGIVQPDDFVPLAEENGLIVDIGRWVLGEACRQARIWQSANEGPTLTMAVNLSARQLADPDLVEDVARALAESGLEPRFLTLEITESALMQDPDIAIGRLHQLKSTGVRLAIDDFGTGYSSLSSLQKLPVDILKIDKGFIDEVTTGIEAAGLVQAIVRLAGTLALDTIAEGVERPDQLQSLRDLGCNQIQGFYFSKPLSPDDVEIFLQHQPTDPPVAPAINTDRPAAII